MRKIYTKEKMLASSVRVSKRDMDSVVLACRLQGISRSEFIRRTLAEKAAQIRSQGTPQEMHA
jgi:predicted HicB family RNase H-like nuclease